MAGTIAANQTICYNANPAAFTSVADASGGTAPYTYQWQYSTNSGSTWNDISGANSTTYDSSNLTATRWFRRRVIDSDSPAVTGYSNTVIVTVYPALNAGTIAANQSICYNDTPALLTSTANASGASGSYVYQWQNSTNGVSYSNIAGATSTTYQPPALTVNTYYKRRVYDTVCGIGGADYSNVILITVYADDFNAGTIGNAQTIYSGQTPALLTFLSAPSGSSGQYTYQWRSGTTSSADDFIVGATGSTFQPPALTVDTWYKCLVTDTYCSKTANTLTIKITVTAAPTSLPPPFCNSVNYSLSNSTCNNSDGSIIINAPYTLYYDFTLTDTFGNSYSIVGSTFTVPSGYYTLTATPKPAYAYAYSTCSIGWVAISDTDTTMTLTPVVRGSTSSYLISQGTGDARIYCDWTDSVSGLTHDHYLYKANGENILTVTGTTGTSDFVKTPVTNGDYYAILINENGCKKLSGLIKVDFIQSPFNLGGVKRVFITEYNDNLNPIFWKTSDEDYFVQSLDLLKFQSAKLKYLSGTTTWYSITTDTDTVFTQSMEKVRQGFIFRNKLTMTFSPSAYYKWVATKELLTKRFVVVFEDCNGNWWIFGYTNEGAEVNVYTRKSDVNAYALEFASNAGDKILTAIDYNNYVLPVIINS